LIGGECGGGEGRRGVVHVHVWKLREKRSGRLFLVLCWSLECLRFKRFDVFGKSEVEMVYIRFGTDMAKKRASCAHRSHTVHF